MTALQWQQDVSTWSVVCLDNTGHYIGPRLTRYGFPYERGEYVPVNERYSAMLAWQWAERAVKSAKARAAK